MAHERKRRDIGRMIRSFYAYAVGLCAISAMASGMATGARAAEPAEPWQLGFQTPSTGIMETIDSFHDFLLIVTTLIVVLVLGLLMYCAIRFNERANPTPSTTTHNTTLEIVWTLIPLVILIGIAFPSYWLLERQLTIPKADLTIKAIGHQWYWEYEYPDYKFDFSSILVEEEDLKAGQLRLLSVDNPIYVPAGATVRLIVTASDVVHAWAMPSFGVKIDAVPGRLNETWFRAEREGVYYGQCSELCGVRHAFMPIELRVVSKREFRRWRRRARREFGAADIVLPPPALAQIEPQREAR